MFHLHEARQRNLQINLIMYSAALGSCDKAGNWQQAYLLRDILVEEQLQPDVVAQNSVTLACSNAGEFAVALPLLHAVGRKCELELWEYQCKGC